MTHDIPPSASRKLGRLKDKAAIEEEMARLRQKKADAGAIVIRHIGEKKSLADAYSEVFPNAGLTRKQMKRRAGGMIRWFRHHFPVAIRQLLFIKGYDDDRVINLIGEQLQATTQLKKRTRRWKEERDDGTTVWVEEIDYIDVPDNKTRADALQKLILLGGHHARNLKPSAKEAEVEEGAAPRNVTSSGAVTIAVQPKLPPGEWRRQYQQAIEESNASGRADKMIRDLERRVAEAEAANGNVTHGPPFPPAGFSPPNVSR